MSFRLQEGPEIGMDAQILDLAFEGELWHWRGPAPYHFITVPEEACVALRAISANVSYGWGMIPVTVRIGTSVADTSLFPKAGRYVVPVKDVVRKAEGLAVGDDVPVQLSIRA
jgi:uncharacterized protein DUF1905